MDDHFFMYMKTCITVIIGVLQGYLIQNKELTLRKKRTDIISVIRYSSVW